MKTDPKRAMALFGTTQAAGNGQRYRVGELEFTFESGGLGHINYAGTEILRGIHYLLRDNNWATPEFALGEIDVDDTGDELLIGYSGAIKTNGIEFAIAAQIRANAGGEVVFAVNGNAAADFLANRIGFSVLHPTPELENVGLDVEHPDGSVSRTQFPETISPSQPVFDVVAFRWSPVEDLAVECRLSSQLPDGSSQSFEMEDQRNWSDASFKTYSGSLLDPFPFKVAAGDAFIQQVVMSCRQNRLSTAVSRSRGATSVTLGPVTSRTLPAVGLAVPANQRQLNGAANDLLKLMGASQLTVYTVANEDALDDKLRHAASLSASLQADVNLEVELPCDASPADEIAGVRAACAGAGLNVASVLCCPAAYLKSYQPSDVWPEVPELSDIYAAARDAFDGSAIGGGMLSYFTELNRKWPPPAGIDFVSHTVSPIVHAADDLTIMENLTTLSAMAATVRERLGNIRYRIGPSAIAMRVNPYGAATLDNPGFRRIAMANADPRECAIFGAAWALGFAAQAAKQGIDQVCLFATSGPQAVYVSADDQARLQDAGIQEAKVKPVFHVLRALAACRDQALIETTVSGPRRRQLATLAVRTDQQIELWITNLGAAATAVALPARAKTSIMNADAIDAVCGDLHWLENAPVNSGDHIELDSFALARCRIAV